MKHCSKAFCASSGLIGSIILIARSVNSIFSLSIVINPKERRAFILSLKAPLVIDGFFVFLAPNWANVALLIFPLIWLASFIILIAAVSDRRGNEPFFGCLCIFRRINLFTKQSYRFVSSLSRAKKWLFKPL